MDKKEWLTKNLGERDPLLRNYLNVFYTENKDLNENTFAEKLSNDPMFNLIFKNVNLYHHKRNSIWINFWSMLFILLSFLSIAITVITLTKK